MTRRGKGEHVLNVQLKNRLSTYGTVIKNRPHFVHVYASVLGSRLSASRPTKGGTHAAAMMYMRRLATLRR